MLKKAAVEERKACKTSLRSTNSEYILTSSPIA
jgi:hypothetical protein